MDHGPALVDQRSSPQAKIALFRSLFRGREDVYASRFVLRFIAEDLAKDLDSVLDRILRSLSSRRKPPGIYPVTVLRGSGA